MSKWVSVNKRLPKVGSYIVYFHNGIRGRVMTKRLVGNGWCGKNQDHLNGFQVTHWMRLPLPPNES